MNKRKTIISFFLTLLILIVGMGTYKALTIKEEAEVEATPASVALREVQVRKLSAASANNPIAIDGRLRAFERVQLSSSVSGILLPASKTLKKGMFVKKGDLLFDIDQRKMVYNLHASRSTLLNAITLIMPDLKSDHPEAYTQWKHYLDEFDVEGSIKTLPTVTSEREKYFVASRNIYNLYYNIKSAEEQLKDYRIYAPFSGVITRADVFPGMMLMPGQPLAAMINTGHFELEATVTETALDQLKIGNTVDLQAVNTSKNWKGKVVRIGNQIDPVTQSIPIYIRVSGKGLREGMYLSGQINGQALSNVIELNKKIVVDQSFVYSLKDSILHLQKIAIQNETGNHVYATPLLDAPWIVHENPRGLYEGQKVIPIFIKD